MVSFSYGRWCWGAEDIVFSKKHHSLFFSCGKVLSIRRGGGLRQPGIKRAIDVLNGISGDMATKEEKNRNRNGKVWGGGWLHMFSEGKVNQSGKLLRLKWGIGKLVARSPVTPIVLPFYHKGMEQVMPLYDGGKWDPFLRTGKSISVLFGAPIDFSREVRQYKQDRLNRSTQFDNTRDPNKVCGGGGDDDGDYDDDEYDLKFYKQITDVIEVELRKLETELNLLQQPPNKPL